MWFPEGAGGDRFDEKSFEGPLARITRDALGHIQATYLKQTVIKHPNRAEAERLWNFPYAAIEEAVVNAVYHRSYEIREPIEVRITPEDLVVLSFPGPDRSIRLEDLKKGKAVSRRCRNRRIEPQNHRLMYTAILFQNSLGKVLIPIKRQSFMVW